MAQLTVDLSADKATLARIAQLILQFAGYEPPTVAATPPAPEVDTQAARDAFNQAASARVGQDLLARMANDPMGQAGLEVTDVEPTQVFAAPQVFDAAKATNDILAAVFAPPPAVIPPPPAGIDVDLRGLPWDPRIHASTRAKTAEGNWRQKRNVDPELMTKVEAELRQTMGAPAIPDSYTSTHAAHRIAALPLTVPVPPAPVVPPSPVVPPVPFAGSAVPPAPPISSTPPVPASAGAVPPASPGNAVTFVQFVHAVTKACTVDKTLTQPQVAAALQKFGVASLPLLSARPDLVGAVSSELGLAL